LSLQERHLTLVAKNNSLASISEKNVVQTSILTRTQQQQQQHTLKIISTTQFNNVKQHNRTHTRPRVSQTNFFIWFIDENHDFIVCLALYQTFPNIMKISDQGSI